MKNLVYNIHSFDTSVYKKIHLFDLENLSLTIKSKILAHMNDNNLDVYITNIVDGYEFVVLKLTEEPINFYAAFNGEEHNPRNLGTYIVISNCPIHLIKEKCQNSYYDSRALSKEFVSNVVTLSTTDVVSKVKIINKLKLGAYHIDFVGMYLRQLPKFLELGKLDFSFDNPDGFAQLVRYKNSMREKISNFYSQGSIIFSDVVWQNIDKFLGGLDGNSDDYEYYDEDDEEYYDEDDEEYYDEDDDY